MPSDRSFDKRQMSATQHFSSFLAVTTLSPPHWPARPVGRKVQPATRARSPVRPRARHLFANLTRVQPLDSGRVRKQPRPSPSATHALANLHARPTVRMKRWKKLMAVDNLQLWLDCQRALAIWVAQQSRACARIGARAGGRRWKLNVSLLWRPTANLPQVRGPPWQSIDFA